MGILGCVGDAVSHPNPDLLRNPDTRGFDAYVLAHVAAGILEVTGQRFDAEGQCA
jgi:hypothetical protein